MKTLIQKILSGILFILFAFTPISVDAGSLKKQVKSENMNPVTGYEEDFTMSEPLKFKELPDEIKKLMINFPDDQEYIYFLSEPVEIEGTWEPDFTSGERNGNFGIMAKATTDYMFKHYEEEPMLDFYTERSYFFGKYMAVEDGILYMNFVRSKAETEDQISGAPLEFPVPMRLINTDMVLTLKGYKDTEKPDMASLYSRASKAMFEIIHGDEETTAVMDSGSFILIGGLTEDMSYIWFLRKDSENFKADYDMIYEGFKSYIVDYHNRDNPQELPEDEKWPVLKEKKNNE